MLSPKDKLLRLRALFASASPKGIAAFIVPSGDAHGSEYVSACDLRREFISGFNGSAGTAVVTPTAALLWTDGRYYLQASQQLSEDWTLMKAGLKDTPSIEVGPPPPPPPPPAGACAPFLPLPVYFGAQSRRPWALSHRCSPWAHVKFFEFEVPWLFALPAGDV